MKVSGHSFDNQVFDSLLKGLKDDIVLKKAEKKEQPNYTGRDVFSSIGEETLKQIKEEELESIASELEFAAGKAKVAVDTGDLAKFAAHVFKDGLRGKELERAAQRYCNKLNRDVCEPKGTMRSNDLSLKEQLTAHRVASATCDPEAFSDGKAGSYLGSRSNPNSIWDSNQLQKLAHTKFGDEQIKESKEAQQKFKQQQKDAHWQELQDKHNAGAQVKDVITNAGTTTEQEVVNQNLAANTMSIFSNDRDFTNIPDKTTGEDIAELAQKRADKSKEAKNEWNQSKPAQKTASTENWFDKLANQPERSDIDKQLDDVKLQ